METGLEKVAQTQPASHPTWLASHGQRVSHISGKKQEKKQEKKQRPILLLHSSFLDLTIKQKLKAYWNVSGGIGSVRMALGCVKKEPDKLALRILKPC